LQERDISLASPPERCILAYYQATCPESSNEDVFNERLSRHLRELRSKMYEVQNIDPKLSETLTLLAQARDVAHIVDSP
jgi:hypothetical protein